MPLQLSIKPSLAFGEAYIDERLTIERGTLRALFQILFQGLCLLDRHPIQPLGRHMAWSAVARLYGELFVAGAENRSHHMNEIPQLLDARSGAAGGSANNARDTPFRCVGPADIFQWIAFMPTPDFVTRLPIQLRPDPARVVIRPYTPADDIPAFRQTRSRAQRIADRLLALDNATVAGELKRLFEDFASRHHDAACTFMRRFHEVQGRLIDAAGASHDRALLIGACFCHEYSFEAVALFNPSIVPLPDQPAAPDGTIRFVMSLRGVGEGHVSSITFRTGTCVASGALTIDPASPRAIVPRIEFLDEALPDAGVRFICDESQDLSEHVIFPVTPSQRHGIEDLRLVRFTEEDGSAVYLGTYTAYSGQAIREEVLRTSDFHNFELRPLGGDAAAGKGMALFPRRIGGRYAMLSRQDHENLWFLTSDNLHEWDGGQRVVTPRWPWEFVQVGNCGSPIEIDEGWLVITHGVGVMRNYCIGACLLDRDDPTKLLARMTRPLLRPDSGEREGYVPNVAYSCGAMVHGRRLVLPYGVADSFTTFASLPLDPLLAAMT